MNPRERWALCRQGLPTDRVPMDFAGTTLTSAEPAAMLSPDCFRELIVPWYSQRIDLTKNLTSADYFHHSCGSVYRLMDDICDMGVDILNPIQPGAAEMEPERLKQGYGSRLIFWGGLDGWPQFSDAIVDYYFTRKLAYGFIKNSQQDVCVMLDEPDNWVQKVVISNDTRTDKSISCRVIDIDTGEAVLEGAFIAYADQSTVVGRIPYARNRQRFFTIRWEGDACGQNHYLAGQPPFELATYRAWLQKSGLLE